MRPSSNVFFFQKKQNAEPFVITLPPNSNSGLVLVTKAFSANEIIIDGAYHGGKLARNDYIIWRRPVSSSSYTSMTYYCDKDTGIFHSNSSQGNLPFANRELEPNDELYFFHLGNATSDETITIPPNTVIRQT